jgi:sugar O-acyltransferase (sialic acid O-acetyltransferase NeuD family)
MMPSKLIIFGSAEIAELAYFYFQNDSDYDVVGFTIDDEFIDSESFLNLPLIPFSKVAKYYSPSLYSMHVALSYMQLNKLREKKYFEAKALGYRLPSYVCSKSSYWSDLSVGENCFILENQTIQPSVKIGNNVVLWSGNHLGHGSVIQDHAYISSHVVISGHCTIGSRTFIGVNSTVKDFTTIGEDCFLGMGSIITGDMHNGSVSISTSASILAADDRRAQFLKKKYFKL